MLTFQEKLGAIFQFSQQVIPTITKDTAKQATYSNYTALGLAGVALIEALFSHTVQPTAPAPASPAMPPTA